MNLVCKSHHINMSQNYTSLGQNYTPPSPYVFICFFIYILYTTYIESGKCLSPFTY